MTEIGHNSAHRFAKGHLKAFVERVERLEEQEAILETYMQALGMLADTPLGQAAIKRTTANAAA